MFAGSENYYGRHTKKGFMRLFVHKKAYRAVLKTDSCTTTKQKINAAKPDATVLQKKLGTHSH